MKHLAADPSWSFLKIANGVLSLAKASLNDTNKQFLKHESVLTSSIEEISRPYHARLEESRTSLQQISSAESAEISVEQSETLATVSKPLIIKMPHEKRPSLQDTCSAVNANIPALSGSNNFEPILLEVNDCHEERSAKNNTLLNENQSKTIEVEADSSPIIRRTRSRKKMQPAAEIEPRVTRSRGRAKKAEVNSNDPIQTKEALPVLMETAAADVNSPELFKISPAEVTLAQEAPPCSKIPDSKPCSKPRKARKAAAPRPARRRGKKEIQNQPEEEKETAVAFDTNSTTNDFEGSQDFVKAPSREGSNKIVMSTESSNHKDSAAPENSHIVLSAKDLVVTERNHRVPDDAKTWSHKASVHCSSAGDTNICFSVADDAFKIRPLIEIGAKTVEPVDISIARGQDSIAVDSPLSISEKTSLTSVVDCDNRETNFSLSPSAPEMLADIDQSVPAVVAPPLVTSIASVSFPKQESLFQSLLEDDNMSDSDDILPKETIPKEQVSIHHDPSQRTSDIERPCNGPAGRRPEDLHKEVRVSNLLPDVKNVSTANSDKPGSGFSYRFIPPTNSSESHVSSTAPDDSFRTVSTPVHHTTCPVKPPSCLSTDQPLFLSSKTINSHEPASACDKPKKSTPPVSGVLQSLLMKARADSIRRQCPSKAKDSDSAFIPQVVSLAAPTSEIELPVSQHEMTGSQQNAKSDATTLVKESGKESLQALDSVNAAIDSTKRSVVLDSNCTPILVDLFLDAESSAITPKATAMLETIPSKSSANDLVSSDETRNDPIIVNSDSPKKTESSFKNMVDNSKQDDACLDGVEHSVPDHKKVSNEIDVPCAPDYIVKDQKISTSEYSQLPSEDDKPSNISTDMTTSESKSVELMTDIATPPRVTCAADSSSKIGLPELTGTSNPQILAKKAEAHDAHIQVQDLDCQLETDEEILDSKLNDSELESSGMEMEVHQSPCDKSQCNIDDLGRKTEKEALAYSSANQADDQHGKSQSVWDTLYNGFSNISTNVASFVHPKPPDPKAKRTVEVKSLKLASAKRKRDMEREEEIKLRNKKFQEAGEARKRKAMGLERQKEHSVMHSAEVATQGSSVSSNASAAKALDNPKKPSERLVELSTEERRKRAEERRLALGEEERRKKQEKEEQRQLQRKLLKKRRKEEEEAAKKKQKCLEEASKKTTVVASHRDQHQLQPPVSAVVRPHEFAIPQLPAPRPFVNSIPQPEQRNSDPIVEIPAEPDPSDYESDEEPDERELRKKIPKWAQQPNLSHSLSLQASIDPDVIFNPDYLRTCNLSEMFTDYSSKTRFTRRTSSGNWLQDRLGWREELEYKRRIGFLN